MGSNSVDILVRDLSVYGQVALGLLLVSLVTDGVLSNRYRDGDALLDHRSFRHLVMSLSTFFTALLLSWRFEIGLVELPMWLQVLGLVVVAGGTLLRHVAISQLGELFTWKIAILDVHQLKTDGLYRWIRHPSYTGRLLGIIGLSLTFESVVALLIALLIHAPVILRRVRLEEIALRLHFGAHFESYAGRTARLVPFIY